MTQPPSAAPGPRAGEEAGPLGANGIAAAPERWSRRRWTYALLGAFGLHVALLALLGARPAGPPPPPRFGMGIYPGNDAWSALQIARLPTLQDPTLFVRPAPQNFSGRAWLSFAPPAHRMSDWSEPPRWLELDPESLGAPFAEYAQHLTNRPLLIAGLPLPRLTGSSLPVPNQPVGRSQRLVVEGPLHTRPLQSPIALPSWPHGDLLSNTVVQLAVDANGAPMLTTVLAESGLRAADAFALQEAARARFEPLEPLPPAGTPDLRLTWGRLVFEWPLTPALTNPAARLP